MIDSFIMASFDDYSGDDWMCSKTKLIAPSRVGFEEAMKRMEEAQEAMRRERERMR